MCCPLLETTPTRMRWGFAEQSSVIRSNQKDDQYLTLLQSSIENELQSRFKLFNSDLAMIITKLLYFALTTGRGGKTLGEEYCSLLQVDTRAKDTAGPFNRILYTISTCLSSSLFDRYSSLLSSLGLVYVGLFYIGRIPSYHLIKQILGFRYIYHPRRAPKALANQPFRRLYICLGIISLGLGLVQTTQELLKLLKRKESTVIDVSDVSAKSICSLCLARRQTSTRIACGHVFCWECICQWLSHRSQCPLCRKEASHADMLVLYNI